MWVGNFAACGTFWATCYKFKGVLLALNLYGIYESITAVGGV